MRTMLLLVPLLLLASRASAGTDQPLAGTKLLLKPTRLDVIANDTAVQLGDGAGTADDPTTAGGTLRMVGEGGGFDVTYPLAASGWGPLSRKKPEKGWRYAKGDPVKKLTIKVGKQVRVIGKGPNLAHTLDADPSPVHVIVTIGTQRYCMTFAVPPAFKAGKKYLAKKAPAPAACFAGATSTTIVSSSTTSTSIDPSSTTTTVVATTTSTTLAVGPNLVPTAFSASASTVAAGGDLTVSFSVQNQGTENATGSWIDQVWLSTDQVIDDPGDTFLANVFSPPSVAPNASYHPTSVPVFVPGGQTPGNYFLLLGIDAEESVGETDESDNASAAPIPITVEAP